jgi:mannose-6-phosphate isomerase
VAELWLGAHPSAPSRVLVADGPGDGEPLDAVVRRDPAGTLGANVSARFGPVLPYLLKVLAAERPLSLQVHPSIAQATAGYDAEESAGIPLTAPDRSYRDRNHKPEMLLALTPFDALCGFRLPLEAAELLEGLAATLTRDLAAILRSLPPEEAIEAAVRRLLEDGSRPTPGEVATVVDACRARLELGSPHPGADRTVLRLAEAYPGDPGVVTSLLLNQFTLEPGQAVFVPAGTVHAYQHGFAVELMSGSDNVLRAGLTSKHMDIPELLATIVYVGGPPVRVTPEQVSPVTQVFHAPVDDFVLSVTRLPDGAEHRLPGRGPRILLCLDGHATLRTAGGTLELARGGSAFVAASEGPVSLSGPGTVVQADVP